MNDENDFAADDAECEHDPNDETHEHDDRDAVDGIDADAFDPDALDADALDADLAARIDALPRTIEPPACLWAGVAARIEADRARARLRRMRIGTAIGAFAIAASIAIGLGVRTLRNSATNATEARSGDAGPSPSSSAAALHSASPSIVPDPSVPVLLPEEPSYRAAAQALRASLGESRCGLPKKSARCLDDDLRLIDSAIDATRTALAKSPDDQVLRAALRDAYQQEIDVLSDVIDLTSRT